MLLFCLPQGFQNAAAHSSFCYRELASQIYEVACKFTAKIPVLGSALLLIGGCDISNDLERISKGGHSIVVGTPGRLAELMEKTVGVLTFRELDVLVLDEADRCMWKSYSFLIVFRLLEMGFQPTISSILTRLPKQRRTVRYNCDYIL